MKKMTDGQQMLVVLSWVLILFLVATCRIYSHGVSWTQVTKSAWTQTVAEVTGIYHIVNGTISQEEYDRLRGTTSTARNTFNDDLFGSKTSLPTSVEPMEIASEGPTTPRP